ncbi:MAG: flavodoxin domain-containing protein [Solirubrobacterales bacterium]
MTALVAYASKRGSTAEIASAVAEELRAAGLEVECRESGEVKELAGYDAVVLGSAVYAKRWRGDARHFLRHHGEALAALPFWVFSSGPVGDPAEEDEGSAEWVEPRRTIARVEELGARGHVVFGGRVPAEPHGMVEKAMAKNVPPEFRDRRDWDEIRAWARGVAAELGARGE